MVTTDYYWLYWLYWLPTVLTVCLSHSLQNQIIRVEEEKDKVEAELGRTGRELEMLQVRGGVEKRCSHVTIDVGWLLPWGTEFKCGQYIDSLLSNIEISQLSQLICAIDA